MSYGGDARLLLLSSHRFLLLLFSLKVLEHWLEVTLFQRLDLCALFLIRQRRLSQTESQHAGGYFSTMAAKSRKKFSLNFAS